MDKKNNSKFVVEGNLTDFERIKGDSNYLRGTIDQDLKKTLTNGFTGDNFYLIRFHGMYQQDDRDIRSERLEQKLEPKYAMMLRCRLPGGVITTDQWIKINDFAINYTFYKTIRLTNRQTFQLHGIFKHNLKQAHQMLHEINLDSLATANDVNRNVICTSNPNESNVSHQVYELSKIISQHLLPKTKAYAEIWLDKKKIFTTEDDEPLLSKFYLPRKFKISIVVPPYNDVDIHANDMSLITILDSKNNIIGFNLLVGGGLSFEHNNKLTWPGISQEVGFVLYKDIISVVESVVTIQRDWGDRTNRKQAKTRYTLHRVGLKYFKKEIEKRSNTILLPIKKYHFISRGDRFHWIKGTNQKWNYTLFIPNGRIKNTHNFKLQSALYEIAQTYHGNFKITANQNLIISDVKEKYKKNIINIIKKYGLSNSISYIRQNSMACVSFPTCPLAMAEAERMLENFVTKLELILIDNKMFQEYIVVRVTGCPNGCARALLAEIALVGKSPGKYNLYIGGNRIGTRIPTLYEENVTESEILNKLSKLIQVWSVKRNLKESFGDFVIRIGIVKEIINPSSEFWSKK
ncbi:Sulfite reductase [NADPH] hemoprotein beta-component [Buchnera aphidicola (Thelaxes suberi)]|uniref:assimilatory sulfite reductase (NADPH) hemoprotein subunit n=1 Tax=Buchnera aphidicola TaxID=9 RepID=UPI003463A504